MTSKGNNLNREDVLKDIKFRMVDVADTEEILEIYKPYVTNTVITFEYDVPSIEEFKSRIEDISSQYPYIVCTYKDKIVGYAYAHKYAERAAYQWDVEASIYLDMNYKSLGIGKILYKKMIDILKLQNVQNVYACVTSANEKSIKFHQKLGFEFIGVFKDTGYKFDKWYDVTWFGMSINDKDGKPKELKSIKEVDFKDILNILEKNK